MALSNTRKSALFSGLYSQLSKDTFFLLGRVPLDVDVYGAAKTSLDMINYDIKS